MFIVFLSLFFLFPAFLDKCIRPDDNLASLHALNKLLDWLVKARVLQVKSSSQLPSQM